MNMHVGTDTALARVIAGIRCREAALRLHELSGNASELRDGMKVDDLRVIGQPVPGLPNLKLSGEYVWQGNDDQKGRGWYAERVTRSQSRRGSQS